jgi:hypothetical protein
VKRLGWVALLGAGAALVSLVSAPMLLFLAAGSTPPLGLSRIVALVAYELGMFMPAVVTARAGRRFLAVDHRLACVVLTGPLIAEASVSALFGALPVAYTSVDSMVVRLLMAAFAVALTFYPRR